MKQKRILLHLAFWIFYLLFKTFQNIGAELEPTAAAISLHDIIPLFNAQLILLVVKIPMVYALFYVIDQYLDRIWNIWISILAGIGIYILSIWAFFPVRQFIILHIYHLEVSDTSHNHFFSIISTLFILLFISSIAISIKLVRKNIRQKRNEQELIKNKLENELQFLKAQTNPHFLFNTLNNIYALARKKSDDTADVVMKLSKLLRFMLYESQHQFITIAQEIQVLEDYMELEKIRQHKKMDLRFTQEIDNMDQSIAPLILLPFVENAFKHGASESLDDSFIHIDLKLKSGILNFSVVNSKNEIPEEVNGDHLGLKNIKRQLELQYKIHELLIENNSNDFNVSLMINLNSHA